MLRSNNYKTDIMRGGAYEKQGYESYADILSVCHSHLSGHSASYKNLVDICHNNRAVPACCFDLPYQESKAQVVSSRFKVKRIMEGELCYEL